MPFTRVRRTYPQTDRRFTRDSFELAYAEDFGGNEVLRLLEERKALSGLHYILETVAVPSTIASNGSGFQAMLLSRCGGQSRTKIARGKI
jgi:hypothetical protein